MERVIQTKTGEGEGNCLAACVASLLHMGDQDLPTFTDGPQWWTELVDWIRPRGWWALRWEATDAPTPSGYSIASGESRRFPGTLHAVVYLENEIAHDPHPDQIGLVGPVVDWIVLVPIDPGVDPREMAPLVPTEEERVEDILEQLDEARAEREEALADLREARGKLSSVCKEHGHADRVQGDWPEDSVCTRCGEIVVEIGFTVVLVRDPRSN